MPMAPRVVDSHRASRNDRDYALLPQGSGAAAFAACLPLADEDVYACRLDNGIGPEHKDSEATCPRITACWGQVATGARCSRNPVWTLGGN